MNKHTIIGLGAAVATLAAPQLVLAEQTTTTGAGTITAAARLDFQVVIPRFLLFRVGSPAAVIDLIDVNVPAANVGDGSDMTPTGGDLTNGQVTARVVSNAGQITITPTNNSGGAGLGNGFGNFIPYTEFLETTNNPSLPTPNLANAGGTSVPVTLAGAITNQLATWDYDYDNTAVYAGGTYGAAANGGRVTYTASSP